jgi:hypothetical protein
VGGQKGDDELAGLSSAPGRRRLRGPRLPLSCGLGPASTRRRRPPHKAKIHRETCSSRGLKRRNLHRSMTLGGERLNVEASILVRLTRRQTASAGLGNELKADRSAPLSIFTAPARPRPTSGRSPGSPRSAAA